MNEKPIIDESDFYNFIVGITKYSNCHNVLIRDSQTIYDVILKDYKKNIHLAAMRGLNKAYLCIYEIGARYKETIPIDAFVNMNDEMKEKFSTFKIEPILERIKRKLHPFIIEVKKLDLNELIGEFITESVIRSNNNETQESEFQSELSLLEQGNVPEIYSKHNLFGIIVSWEKK
jgi:hypothetical protein